MKITVEVDKLFSRDTHGMPPPFFLIAGPCVLENPDLHVEVMHELEAVHNTLGIPVIFKASFDKANRRGARAARGPGLVDGLELLKELKQEFPGIPLLTDIHEPYQASLVAEVCDVLQIPANLCRQTDLLEAAAMEGRPLNLKKGQWVDVQTMAGALGKIGDVPASITERGTFFGYGDLVVDMRNITRMHRELEVPVIYDGTHSVQRPARGPDGASGGDREQIIPLVRAATACGANGLFLEVHPRPEDALSDGASMLRLFELLPLMHDVMAIRRALFG